MELEFFIKGIAIGFSLAIPVGPIGLLLIRRTLTRGRVAGLASGLGAATADALYGCIAGFGVTLLSNFLLENSYMLRVVGGAFLCYLGIKIFLSKPSEKRPSIEGSTLLSYYLSTIILTLGSVQNSVSKFIVSRLASTQAEACARSENGPFK